MATSILEEILREARAAKASDVHLTAGLPPKMRVNGKLLSMNYPRLVAAETLDILLGILPEAQRGRFEEKGEYSFSCSVPEVGRCRVSAYNQTGSVALALRLVETNVPSLEALGVPEAVEDLCNGQRGLILVAGPLGSGKSTTLAAMIDKINASRDAHILTLEDPIEYLHQHKKSMVHQREIGVDSINYANALQAALKEDVDVLMIGELRDSESVNAAVMAAEAGCVVLSAMNTDRADEVINRMVDLFPPYRQEQIRVRLENVLEAVVFQQLPVIEDGGERQAVFQVLPGGKGSKNTLV